MTVPITRTCGSMIHHAYLMETYPSYRQTRLGIENQLLSFTTRMAAAPQALEVITIPVVVHVVFTFCSCFDNVLLTFCS
jgi:hypothetical protein